VNAVALRHALVVACSLVLMPLNAEILAHEPFDGPLGAVTGFAGGSGWAGPWTQDGETGSIVAPGLSYLDGAGDTLQVSGHAASTAGPATTRNFRSLASGPIRDCWISLLYQLPASNSKFEGVTFYRGNTSVFAVQNPSTELSAAIFLGNSATGSSSQTGKGSFGITHFVVLHLRRGAGSGGGDLLEAFVDPLLSTAPEVASTSTTAANLSFDSLRVAAQDGTGLQIDEIRIGTTYADVAPYFHDGNVDRDQDGLTDDQEQLLGLDPAVSNAELVAAIRANPEFFGLVTRQMILSQAAGGVVIEKSPDFSAAIRFQVEHSSDLQEWLNLETFTRSFPLPEGKNFLRITLDQR
jgi:hypothetical protein